MDRQTKAIRVDAVKAVKLIIESEWDGHQQAFHITVTFFFILVCVCCLSSSGGAVE